MTRRNWEKVRLEHLCAVRGSEKVGEDLPIPASETTRPTGLRQSGDFIATSSAASGKRSRQSGRITIVLPCSSGKALPPTDKELKVNTPATPSGSRSNPKEVAGSSRAEAELRSELLVLLHGADAICRQSETLQSYTDSELKEACGICLSVITRLNTLTWKRRKRGGGRSSVPSK